MPLTKILLGDYTQSRSYYQIRLPIDLEPMILDNAPVRLLCRQNINYMYMLEGKFHWKIQSQKTGIRLYELIETA